MTDSHDRLWGETMKLMEARSLIERKHEWREWILKIPALAFDPSWQVQVIPPFGGAIARFRVMLQGCKEGVSVYLDAYDELGCVGAPYWEVYPVEGDTARCMMEDTEELLRLISKGLEEKSDA